MARRSQARWCSENAKCPGSLESGLKQKTVKTLKKAEEFRGKRRKSHSQVFQLKLADCVVGLDVFRDQGELEVGVFKDGVSLLLEWPVLGTLHLHVTLTERAGGQRGRRSRGGHMTGSSPILSR